MVSRGPPTHDPADVIVPTDFIRSRSVGYDGADTNLSKVKTFESGGKLPGGPLTLFLAGSVPRNLRDRRETA
jgi:hypothetical protein